ncbi:unnamed protein product [Linum trigynum]|uniref:RNase H type-1 domain-containing protein n=1 Tax=Linum trigynum TaxID=586398 RepID=A0AAV2DTR1_9ROSI
MTQDLGRYLEVPVLHGRVTNKTFRYIIDRIDQRLAGWKADNLSLAGRVTLAMSVLNAIPSYIMQTAVLPAGICEYIYQKIRAFVWGSQEGRRRIHLVNWETVCLPKDQGGLGLRSARALNTAYFLKLAWGILKKPEELWLWRGVRRAWNLLLEGVRWSVRNGNNTLFWQDKWVDSGMVLGEHMLPSARDINVQASVASMLNSVGEWDTEFLTTSLQADALLQVLGMPPPKPELGDDELVWGLDQKGEFTLKTAYQLVAEIDGEDAQQGWKGVWKWPGPNRVWSQALPSAISASDNRDFNSWFMHHLTSPETQVRFGFTLWFLWRSRNDYIFSAIEEEPNKLTQKILAWETIAHDGRAAEQAIALGRSGLRRDVAVGWRPAPTGWITVNSDGSLLRPLESTAAGGALRDGQGRLLGSYSMNLGKCSTTRAELWGAIQGLQMTWDLGHRKVELQLDSMTAERDWELQISHIYREGNFLADHLAHLGHSLQPGTFVYNPTDSYITHWTLYDSVGGFTVRSII